MCTFDDNQTNSYIMNTKSTEKSVARVKNTPSYLFSHKDVINYLMQIWDKKTIKEIEMVYVILLNKHSRKVMHHFRVAVGNVDSCYFEVDEIIRIAIKKYASGIIIAHNHPSGCLAPSEVDITTTQNLITRCSIVGIELMNHYIVTDDETKYTPLLTSSEYSDLCYLSYRRFLALENEKSYESAVLRFVDKFCEQAKQHGVLDAFEHLKYNMNRIFIKYCDPLLK